VGRPVRLRDVATTRALRRRISEGVELMRLAADVTHGTTCAFDVIPNADLVVIPTK
jgi:hypothetical protein